MGEVLEKKDSVYKLSKLGGNSSGVHLRPRILSQPGEGPSFLGRENPLKSSFRQERDLREERILHEHFLINLNRSIETIIDQLDNTDAIVNFAGLKELFHRKGVNMRFEWIVYIKVKSQRAKTLIGADILARCLKRMLNDKTSKRFRSFGKQAKVNYLDPSVQKRLEDEITENKMEFYLENYFKKILCMYINSLIKDSSESQDYDEHNNFIFQELNTDLFLHRVRVMKFAKKSLDPRSFDYYLSPDITKTLINLPCFNASTFLDVKLSLIFLLNI